MGSITREDAIEQGFTIDDTCNPPVAYKGPRFDPDVWHTVVSSYSKLRSSVKQYLDVSTAHITEITSKWLHSQVSARGSDMTLAVYEYEEGFFIPVHDKDDLLDARIPQDLWVLLVYAAAKGTSLIQLDRDGPKIDTLKTYEW